MICLQCGHCCFYPVAIVVDPALGITETNIRMKGQDERCPHLNGDKPGEYSCSIHDEPWYSETPCCSHGQIEKSNTDCRMGKFLLHGKTV